LDALHAEEGEMLRRGEILRREGAEEGEMLRRGDAEEGEGPVPLWWAQA
jgi:hypothetical protein